MTSYISTQTISSSLRQSVLRMQTELAASVTETATGNHADIGLTLGDRTGLTVSLQAENSMLKTLTETNQIVSIRLSTTQNILSGLQASAQDLLDALLQANGSTSNANTIQSAGQSDLKALIASLNSTLDGNYIFAGTNTGTQPIADYFGPLAANKLAVDTSFLATFGMSQSNSGISAITGPNMQNFLDNQFAPLFQGANWPANWSSATNQTLTNRISEVRTVPTSTSANDTAFQQLAQAYTMIADLGIQNLNPAAYQAVANTAQTVLSSAISKLVDLQASMGVVQSNVENADTQMNLQMNILAAQIGNLESVNSYEVATRVTDLQTQIESSYSLTSQLHQLSLAKYL
jgi:flagellar hook-associated protein 3 FlgL